MPKACLRHDAGRGRGWGYPQRATKAVGRRRVTTRVQDMIAYPRVFTPPLTPPRQGEGNPVEQASWCALRGFRVLGQRRHTLARPAPHAAQSRHRSRHAVPAELHAAVGRGDDAGRRRRSRRRPRAHRGRHREDGDDAREDPAHAWPPRPRRRRCRIEGEARRHPHRRAARGGQVPARRSGRAGPRHGRCWDYATSRRTGGWPRATR